MATESQKEDVFECARHLQRMDMRIHIDVSFALLMRNSGETQKAYAHTRSIDSSWAPDRRQNPVNIKPNQPTPLSAVMKRQQQLQTCSKHLAKTLSPQVILALPAQCAAFQC